MQRVKQTLRLLSLAGLSLVISACSSTPSDAEIAETFASQRAEMLGKIVPVEMNDYTLVRAKSTGGEIELTLLYAGSGKITPATFTDNMLDRYCKDPEITGLLDKGVSYKMLVRDMRGRPVLTRVINRADCP